MRADQVNLLEGTDNTEFRSTFRTDGEISKAATNDSKQLKAVDSTWLQGTETGGLEDSASRGWDQFKTNEELFGVKAAFDENQYTTELRKDKISPEKLRWAERQAAEIERSVSSNIHIAEERNQARQQDLDEETLYSGVSRTKSKSTGASTGSSRRTFADVLKVSEQKNADTANSWRTTHSGKDEGQSTWQKRGTSQSTSANDSTAGSSSSERTTTVSDVAENTSLSVPIKSTTTFTLAAASSSAESSQKMPTESPANGSVENPATATTTVTSSSTGITPKKPKGSLASRLNPDAKEFKVNPNAQEFVPSSYSGRKGGAQTGMASQQVPAYTRSFVPASGSSPGYFSYPNSMPMQQSAAPSLPLSQPAAMPYNTVMHGYQAMHPGYGGGNPTYLAPQPQMATTANVSQMAPRYPPNAVSYGYGAQNPYSYQQQQNTGPNVVYGGYTYPRSAGMNASPAFPNHQDQYQQRGYYNKRSG